ncbi:hypothetical protein B0H11DRAFT_2197785 [Mycena galericulata]|nr:hypothetical protein B0H11DRAFT_2197785 [Mycena galericulata]
MARGQLFEGVKYHICPCLPSTQQAQLHSILGGNGAHRVSELKLATRVITDQLHFSAFQESQCKAGLVTSQWVFASIKSGVKQPSRYYSADPAMFFSSLVVSVIGITASHQDLIRTVVTKYGGQWAATLAENVTHLIAGPISESRLPADFLGIVVSPAWIRDSLELEYRQDTTPYVLFKRGGGGPSIIPQEARPSGKNKFYVVKAASM